MRVIYCLAVLFFVGYASTACITHLRCTSCTTAGCEWCQSSVKTSASDVFLPIGYCAEKDAGCDESNFGTLPELFPFYPSTREMSFHLKLYKTLANCPVHPGAYKANSLETRYKTCNDCLAPNTKSQNEWCILAKTYSGNAVTQALYESYGGVCLKAKTLGLSGYCKDLSDIIKPSLFKTGQPCQSVPCHIATDCEHCLTFQCTWCGARTVRKDKNTGELSYGGLPVGACIPKIPPKSFPGSNPCEAIKFEDLANMHTYSLENYEHTLEVVPYAPDRGWPLCLTSKIPDKLLLNTDTCEDCETKKGSWCDIESFNEEGKIISDAGFCTNEKVCDMLNQSPKGSVQREIRSTFMTKCTIPVEVDGAMSHSLANCVILAVLSGAFVSIW